MNKSRVLMALIALTMMSSLFLNSCATTKDDWQIATQIHTVEAYSNFLQKYPNSEFSSDAMKKIEDLKWRKALQTNTSASYKQFLREYPMS